MNQSKLIALLGIVLVVVLTVSSTVYTVDERERVIVVRLGEVLRYDDAPGVHLKLPFLDTLRYFDSRVLTMDADAQPFLTQEKKYVLVDSYVKWRIQDPLKYFLTVGGSESGARQRLEQLTNSGLRDEVNKRPVKSVVSTDRAKIMQIVTAAADAEARKFGIEVVDVRLQRVDLPDEVSQSVYQRMKAERSRIANELRAQGAEAAEKIRAEAERKREIMLADAYRKGESMRGEGDARATAIYGAAAGKAPEFYSLYRSLNAYKESFRKKDDIMIVDPSADFFRYMKKPSR
ncbi:MAG: HflC protein [Candidatus Muproteobacteria bacterium RBG_16_64_10]|uniref:Protein HflC n=1 Tax=Candidatus Muproteobacteria bacterium RBG_16_64_10 TaxID=1817757 RepID=A0A1F6SZ52_9PROT|nr:MAG: HflC protein [Candidatus Muproteobacteria bacterium RBG_16_64_10]